MQPLGLAAHISDLIVPTCHDHNRHGQLTIVLLQLHHSRGHQSRIFVGGTKLNRAQHQLLRKEPVEVLRHRRGLEHLAESARQHEAGQQWRDGVAHRIPDLRDGERPVQGHVEASGRELFTALNSWTGSMSTRFGPALMVATYSVRLLSVLETYGPMTMNCSQSGATPPGALPV